MFAIVREFIPVFLIVPWMAASGWLVEGDGPDLVVMCAPA